MKLNIKEATIFAMLGALMYASKVIMDILPNIHLIGVFIVAITVVYRKKALYPIYIFVLLTGLLNGFATWWIPYLYIWTILWCVVMIIPVNPHKAYAPFVYMLMCGMHGMMFGILYAPAQALLFNMNFEATLSWIAAGLPMDLIHGISNFICGLLIVPIINALKLCQRLSGNK